MPAALPRLGILQAGRSPADLLERFPDYDCLFVRLLGDDAFDYRHWPVLDGVFPDSIDDADAWLITGSRFGVYEDHDWIPPLERLIRQIHERGDPMVGICFGHQIIAQALGGKVEKFTGGWSVGRVDYQLDGSVFGALSEDSDSSSTAGSDANAAEGFAETVPLLAFHQDQITELPAGARNVGHSIYCENAALIYDDRILTIQPHPEFDKPFIEALLEMRAEILPPHIQARARNSLDKPIVGDAIARVLRRFLTPRKP